MEIKKTQVSLKRIFNLLENNEETILNGNYYIDKINGKIEFINVSLRYSRDRIIKNINLSINKGEKVAILGANGIGKTSIVRLLLRTHKYSGEIRIDQNNIENYKLECLKKDILFINQKPFIFNGTIKDNILLGSKEIKEDELNKVLEKVLFLDDVNKMSNGINTYVGEKGVLLSGGQMQKIALARMFVFNPSILILDEPTAALDIDAEEIICANIFEHFKDTTIIIITHRKEILKYCSIKYELLNTGLKPIAFKQFDQMPGC